MAKISIPYLRNLVASAFGCCVFLQAVPYGLQIGPIQKGALQSVAVRKRFEWLSAGQSHKIWSMLILQRGLPNNCPDNPKAFDLMGQHYL